MHAHAIIAGFGVHCGQWTCCGSVHPWDTLSPLRCSLTRAGRLTARHGGVPADINTTRAVQGARCVGKSSSAEPLARALQRVPRSPDHLGWNTRGPEAVLAASRGAPWGGGPHEGEREGKRTRVPECRAQGAHRETPQHRGHQQGLREHAATVHASVHTCWGEPACMHAMRVGVMHRGKVCLRPGGSRTRDALLLQCGRGEARVAGACELARSLVEDNSAPAGVPQLAAMGASGRSQQNAERDMHRPSARPVCFCFVVVAVHVRGGRGGVRARMLDASSLVPCRSLFVKILSLQAQPQGVRLSGAPLLDHSSGRQRNVRGAGAHADPGGFASRAVAPFVESRPNSF